MPPLWPPPLLLLLLLECPPPEYPLLLDPLDERLLPQGSTVERMLRPVDSLLLWLKNDDEPPRLRFELLDELDELLPRLGCDVVLFTLVLLLDPLRTPKDPRLTMPLGAVLPLGLVTLPPCEG